MKKVLITTRDPSSGNDFIEIIKNLLKNQYISLMIIAEEPSYSILSKHINYFDKFKNYELRLFEPNNLFIKEIKIKELILNFSPEIIITGVSGPDYGVDEICLKVSNELGISNTYSLQSYWGDINSKLGAVANNFFVIDQYAKKITEGKTSKSKIHITGNQQFFKWKKFNWLLARKNLKIKYNINQNKTIFSFFSQPLDSFEWYWETLNSFLKVIGKNYSEVLFIIKMHPKDKEASKYKYERLCKKFNIKYLILEKENFLNIVSASKLIFSLNSTVCYTSQIMLSGSSTPFTIPIYLFFNQDFKLWSKKITGLEEIPLSNNLSIVIDSKSKIKESIDNALDNILRKFYHHQIKKNISQKIINPANEVTKVILGNDLKTN